MLAAARNSGGGAESVVTLDRLRAGAVGGHVWLARFTQPAGDTTVAVSDGARESR
jgi:hypothetical protein